MMTFDAHVGEIIEFKLPGFGKSIVVKLIKTGRHTARWMMYVIDNLDEKTEDIRATTQP